MKTKNKPKNFTELTKDELITLIYNNSNIGYNSTVGCAVCGSVKADFYYECENCQKLAEEDDEYYG